MLLINKRWLGGLAICLTVESALRVFETGLSVLSLVYIFAGLSLITAKEGGR